MNPFTFINRIRTSGRRRTLSALLVMWVGLGVQPCAVAAVSEGDCPHCPPTIDAQQMDVKEHCGTDAELIADVSGVAGDCCETDDGAIDARSYAGKVVDNIDVSTGPPPTPTSVSRLTTGTLSESAYPPKRRRSSVPLRILYCVYRD
jgi:hypothetical protein